MEDFIIDWVLEKDKSEDSMVDLEEVISKLPQRPQVQYGLTDQLLQLKTIANKFGLYDAADIVRNILEK